MTDHLAVYVKSAQKTYGKDTIFENLSMSVEKATIYGLLGASGCGKTTLLNCIIGRKKLDKGDVWTLGYKPGTKGVVPGPRMGYMPQDTALVPEYTVKETIYFFGRIANMSDDRIFNRFYELSKLLDLPPRNQYVRDCSGGEQRRISLAATIVSEPELLILDEPTVGVDSVLREKIWSYFIELVRDQKVTVLLTTHYIEECNGADKVGLMRNGHLLTEQPPLIILSLYESETLEQAFLKLCIQEDEGKYSDIEKNQNSMYYTPSTSMQSFQEYQSTEKLLEKPNEPYEIWGVNPKHVQSLLHKNWTQFKRNIMGLILFGVLPITQTFFFVYCIGGQLRDLKLGIINYEVPWDGCHMYDKRLSAIPNSETYDCTFRNLSCRFIEYLDDPMIDIMRFDGVDDATEAIKHGIIIAYIYFPQNFSQCYEEKARDMLSVDPESLESAKIHGEFDMSSKPLGEGLKYKLIDLFLDFQRDLYQDCNWNKRIGQPPINEHYLFGKKYDPYLMFLIPGLLATFGFFFGATMTSQIIVSEKCEGVWDRSLAAGVTTLEVVLGHLILQFSICVFHALTPLIVTLYIYGLEYQGSFFHMALICIIQNSCGLVLGFYISVASKTHSQANYTVTGILLPVIIMCGMLWPLESLPYFLQLISKCLPVTLPIVGLRNVIRKGESFWTPQLLTVNLIPIGWITVLILLSLWQIKTVK
ncbi:ABC transporter G family member 23-like [Anthonomus grandis grandis]|uniref:ABC transporter G family member 23-like n=1 Tax=Anthonomus grandis grandis TaxID=2921223 RepID=UPI002165D918|nr:ABC transporter G family member 23-like [Anthonomus grandis grandis]